MKGGEEDGSQQPARDGTEVTLERGIEKAAEKKLLAGRRNDRTRNEDLCDPGAIRDSGETVDPARPGVGACGPNDQSCAGDLAGATFTEAWKLFRTWTAPVLSFTSAPQTIPAGAVSGPMTLALLSSAGTPQIATALITVTLSSNSPKGQFSTSAAGPRPM